MDCGKKPSSPLHNRGRRRLPARRRGGPTAPTRGADVVTATRESRRLVEPGRDVIYAVGRCRGRGDGALQAGDDALGIVPVDEYETVFSFPTVGKDSEMCVTRCHGFWLTFYVDAARSDSGQGPRGNKTKYARSLRAFKARASKHDPPKVFVSTPPAGLFSHRDIVWQGDVQWPYEINRGERRLARTR